MMRCLPEKATFRHSQIASCHFINSKDPHLNEAGKENIYACLSGGPSFFFWGASQGASPGMEECDVPWGCPRPFYSPGLIESPKYSQGSSGWGWEVSEELDIGSSGPEKPEHTLAPDNCKREDLGVGVGATVRNQGQMGH